MAVNKKKIKTGGMTLEEAKRKINDPNYNVMSGRIEKDKNIQTGPNKRRITKEDMMNIGMGVLPFSRIPKFLSRIPQMLKPSQRFQKLVTNTQRIKTQPLPKPRPKSLRSTAVTKPRATQLKKPSTAVTSKPNITRVKPSSQPFLKSLADIGLKTGIVAGSLTPKKVVSDDKPKTKKPKKSPVAKVKKEKLSSVKAPVKKKRSNIRGSSTYDAQFTYDNLVKKGGKKFAKARMSPENYAKVKKKAGGGTMKRTMKMTGGGSLKPVPEGNKGKGLSKLPTEVRNKMGFMKKGGKLTSNKAKINKVTTGLRKAVKAHTGQAKMLSSIKLNKGGKVIKMRGGGAATKGLRFNRGY